MISCISILLVSGMCILTYFKLKSIWWLIIGIAVGLCTGFVIYHHLKTLKKYKEANSRGSKRFDYKAEYVSLFPSGLPEKMPATDLTREIAPMQNRQSRDVYNNAIRDLITTLNSVNNPNDLLCKNVNTYGSLFAQPRRRCYVRQEDGKFVVYDADFMNPKGELIIDQSDLHRHVQGADLPESGKRHRVQPASLGEEVHPRDREDRAEGRVRGRRARRPDRLDHGAQHRGVRRAHEA